MDPIKCGCALAREAEKEVDPYGQKMLRVIAKDLQRQWQCPVIGFDPPEHRSTPTDPQCQGALDSVHRLTGVRCGGTCPYWYASQPDVIRAARLRRWRDKGQLQMRVRHLSAAMADAIDAIDEGRADRDEYDVRRMREDAEEREKERKRESLKRNV
jgi:hypothetical protein